MVPYLGFNYQKNINILMSIYSIRGIYVFLKHVLR